jgi:hypothetical protein
MNAHEMERDGDGREIGEGRDVYSFLGDSEFISLDFQI